MGLKYDMWTDPFNNNLSVLESQLTAAGLPIKSESVEGDESTCFYSGVVYCFETSDQLDVAQEIYDNL